MDLDLEKFRELVDKRSGNRTFAIGGVTFRSSLALSKQQKAEVRRVVKRYRALERDPDHDVDMWEGADLSREILTAAAEDKQKAKALIDGFDDREVDAAIEMFNGGDITKTDSEADQGEASTSPN
ncbi:hypothetical protein EK0264_03755 [Epidermidibacterium keratini]|uniref:Uncharacterized protein n=1 Tax=Epidermidibacterium keratini TaxID=1891644 RepID=A0A7L4YJT1_9ACTN|nr:hypothetical protein [Epidermidibacterium keratini]QHB99485.1 hypothetical protein EK0264_03755 [Epidermidibacterium keratini]